MVLDWGKYKQHSAYWVVNNQGHEHWSLSLLEIKVAITKLILSRKFSSFIYCGCLIDF